MPKVIKPVKIRAQIKVSTLLLKPTKNIVIIAIKEGQDQILLYVKMKINTE